MTYKERLKEIKGLLVKLHNAIDVDNETKSYIFNDLKLEWLIEQAERVQELENHLKLYDFWYRTAYEQNKRYREALEFYAEGKHVAYKLDETDDDLVVDYGEKARQALDESE